MTQKRINGVNLSFDLEGQGETTIVLIHGNVGSARWWDPVWAPLTDKYQVLRVDLRGCGQSERPGHGHSVPQYSADVRALLQELDLRDVIVVGHSMGGSITMDMATAEPDRLKGMVLLNSAPAEGIVTPDERKPLIEMMIKDRNLMKMALAAVIPTAATGDFFELLVDDAMIAGPTMVPNYTSLGEADYREKLKGLDLPTLILYGNQDSLITLDMMERTRDAIAGSELITYEGIGHSPNVELPERFLQDLVAFVEKVK